MNRCFPAVRTYVTLKEGTFTGATWCCPRPGFSQFKALVEKVVIFGKAVAPRACWVFLQLGSSQALALAELKRQQLQGCRRMLSALTLKSVLMWISPAI